ncbi:MAG: hypothetical protein LBT74_01245 [Acidobacteriota bacterium]|jgi:hypothetical protein|nr:hypothetical protein [Acidobacteriota bacterium]
MNFIDRILLRIALLPSSLYGGLGVDVRQLRAILSAKLTMDNRRPAFGGGGRKERKAASLGMMAGQLLAGIFLLFSFAIGESALTRLTVFMSMFLVMVCFTLITDFTSVLIDVRDNSVILPKPVTDATFATGRLLHIAIRIAMVVLPLALPGCVAFAVMQGVAGVPAYWPMVALETLLGVFVINAAYLLILRVTTPAKFQRVIGVFQIAFMMLVVAASQVVPRMVGAGVVPDIDVAATPLVRLVPPFWFADACLLLSGAARAPASFLSLALSVAVPLLSVALVVRFLAPSFNRKLGMVAAVATGRGGAGKAAHGATDAAKGALLRRVARWLTRPGVERAGFMFVARMALRSRDFKMKVYPQFGNMAALWAVSLFRDPDRLVQALHDPGQMLPWLLPMLLLVVYIGGIPLSVALQQVACSEKSKASWMFSLAPLERPGPFIGGGAKCLLALFLIPAALPPMALGVALMGWGALPNLLLGGANLLALGAVGACRTMRRLPFTVPQDAVGKGASFLQTILAMAAYGAVGLLHWLASGVPWVVCLWLALSATVVWLALRRIGRRTWASMG